MVTILLSALFVKPYMKLVDRNSKLQKYFKKYSKVKGSKGGKSVARCVLTGSKKTAHRFLKGKMGWVVTAGIVKKLGIDFFHLQQEWNLEIPDAGRLEVAVEIVFKALNTKTVIPRRKKRSV